MSMLEMCIQEVCGHNFKLPAIQQVKITVSWDVTPCSVVDRYKLQSTGHQKTAIFIIYAVRTSHVTQSWHVSGQTEVSHEHADQNGWSSC